MPPETPTATRSPGWSICELAHGAADQRRGRGAGWRGGPRTLREIWIERRRTPRVVGLRRRRFPWRRALACPPGPRTLRELVPLGCRFPRRAAQASRARSADSPGAVCHSAVDFPARRAGLLHSLTDLMYGHRFRDDLYREASHFWVSRVRRVVGFPREIERLGDELVGAEPRLEVVGDGDDDELVDGVAAGRRRQLRADLLGGARDGAAPRSRRMASSWRRTGRPPPPRPREGAVAARVQPHDRRARASARDAGPRPRCPRRARRRPRSPAAPASPARAGTPRGRRASPRARRRH